jgi:hypothetical protein
MRFDDKIVIHDIIILIFSFLLIDMNFLNKIANTWNPKIAGGQVTDELAKRFKVDRKSTEWYHAGADCKTWIADLFVNHGGKGIIDKFLSKGGEVDFSNTPKGNKNLSLFLSIIEDVAKAGTPATEKGCNVGALQILAHKIRETLSKPSQSRILQEDDLELDFLNADKKDYKPVYTQEDLDAVGQISELLLNQKSVEEGLFTSPTAVNTKTQYQPQQGLQGGANKFLS